MASKKRKSSPKYHFKQQEQQNQQNTAAFAAGSKRKSLKPARFDLESLIRGHEAEADLAKSDVNRNEVVDVEADVDVEEEEEEEEEADMPVDFTMDRLTSEAKMKTKNGGLTSKELEAAKTLWQSGNAKKSSSSSTADLNFPAKNSSSSTADLNFPANKSWDEGTLQRALNALRKKEISANKASKLYGIPSSTLYKIARRENIELAQPFNAVATTWSQDDLKRALAAIRKGMPVQKAGAEFGIPSGTLYGRCKKVGIELSKSANAAVPWAENDMKGALESVRLGKMSINQAAIHHNLPYSSLYGRINRLKKENPTEWTGFNPELSLEAFIASGVQSDASLLNNKEFVAAATASSAASVGVNGVSNLTQFTPFGVFNGAREAEAK